MTLVDPNDLVGRSDIARLAHVEYQTVGAWINRGTTRNKPPFPKPVTQIGASNVYSWTAVQQWLRDTRRVNP